MRFHLVSGRPVFAPVLLTGMVAVIAMRGGDGPAGLRGWQQM